MPATPLFVIRALAEVRDSGLTDMDDRDAVEMLVTNQRAAEWINKASEAQYEEACDDMFAADSDDFLGHYEQSDFSDDATDFTV